ncbi:uncharacterized protein LOC119091524 [Pollicipes pollicipes]|uniref:uncharacterized protein LOC119091524 n=1 Tax=Pollicipes pollicipes TaxID=41117 RepID=UPI0018858F94|nr:uncharacterized protein LOC119091524 [Pollicipes pollicipes]
MALQRQWARDRRDQEMKERLGAVLTETLIAEVCLDETNDLAEEEIMLVEKERSRHAKNRAADTICATLWTEEAERLAWETAIEVHTDHRRQRAARLQAATEIGRRLTLRRLV